VLQLEKNRYIPSGIAKILPNIFEGCKGLEEVCLPSKLKPIGKEAFSDCTALSRINVPVSAIVDPLGRSTEISLELIYKKERKGHNLVVLHVTSKSKEL